MAPKKSAVYYFALECKGKRGLSGSMREIIEAIYPEWQAMTPNQKAPYERTAHEQRQVEKLGHNCITSSMPASSSSAVPSSAASVVGTSLDDLAHKARASREQTRKDIETFMRGRSEEALVAQHWYFIKFVTFCHCDLNEEGYESYYVLAELGLVKYSLFDGIVDSYHSFIKPNKIPLGYLSKCMDSSRDIHHIPIESAKNASLVKSTYGQIYRDICEFVSLNNNNWVRLFCMPEDLEETCFGLEYLYDQAIAEDRTNSLPKLHGLVADLECLVVALSLNRLMFGQANELLNKYSFDYSPQTKCKFHEEEGVLCCALGIVKRKAYLISDHLCPLHNIQVTPNHLPIGTLVEEELSDRYSFFQFPKHYRSRAKETYNREGSNALRNDRSGYKCSKDIRYSNANFEVSAHKSTRATTIADKFEQNSQVTSKSSRMTKATTTVSIIETVVSRAEDDDDDDDDDDDADDVKIPNQQLARGRGRCGASSSSNTAKVDENSGWYTIPVAWRAFQSPVTTASSSPPPHLDTGVQQQQQQQRGEAASNLNDGSVVSNSLTTSTKLSFGRGFGYGRGRGN